jgi:hypothetical protein
MPWTVKKGSGARPYKIIKKTTGQVVGTSKTKQMAEKSIAARYASEPRWGKNG